MSAAVTKATAADAAAIHALETACIECPWQKADLAAALACPDYEFYKAEEGGRIVGYAGVRWTDGEGDVQNVAVAEDCRRRGVGSALVGELARAADARKARLFLEVNEHNAAARALYAKFGFAVLYERKRYYGDASALVMVRG